MLAISSCGYLVSCGSSTSQLDSNEAKIRAFESEFGVPLDAEAAVVYSMAYEIGSRANPGTTVGHLIEIARQGSVGVPKFRKILEAGVRDGFEGKPNRINGVRFDKPNALDPPPVEWELSDYCGRGDLAKVKSMASPGNVNRSDEGGFPLHEACRNGHLEVAMHLLSIGAEVNKPDGYGKYPIHHSAQDGNLKLFKLLLARGAKIDQKTADPIADKIRMESSSISRIDPNDGDQPIHFAARYNKLEICRYLVEKGVPYNAENNHGSTPLMCASGGGWIPSYADTIRFFDKLGDGTYEQKARSAASGTPDAKVRTDGLYLYRERDEPNGLTHALRFHENRSVEFCLIDGAFSVKDIKYTFKQLGEGNYKGFFKLIGPDFDTLEVTLSEATPKYQKLTGRAKGDVLDFTPSIPFLTESGFGSYSGTFKFYPD